MCYSWLCRGTVSSLCCTSSLGASCFLLLSSNTGNHRGILPKLQQYPKLLQQALPRLSAIREDILLLYSTQLPVSPFLLWDPYSCLTFIRILISSHGAAMNWRGGAFSLGDALVLCVRVSQSPGHR